MDVFVKAVLPIVTLASGWVLASWNNRRHRNWDALSSDLDLADKLETFYPDHAQWIRDSVAIRLKGRALSESRPRSDFLAVTVGALVCLFGASCLLVAVASFRQAAGVEDKWSSATPFFAGLCIVPMGVAMLVSGIKSAPRLPGVSELFLPQERQTQEGLSEQLGRLHRSAIKLPDLLNEPPGKSAGAGDVDARHSAPDRTTALSVTQI